VYIPNKSKFVVVVVVVVVHAMKAYEEVKV
jgi:hypothetical protein